MNKKKFFKALVSLSLALMLSTNISYAATSKKVEDKIPTSLTVTEAVDYALKHNGDVLTLKFKQDELSNQISSIKSMRKLVNDQIEYAEATGQSVIAAYTATQTASFDGYLLRNKITEKRLDKQKALLQKLYDMRTEMLKISIENAYYQVLIDKINLDDAQRNLDVIKKQVEVGAIKLKYGTISEMDYKSLEINQNAAELTLLQADYTYKESKMDFNEMLGLDFNTEIELTSPLEIAQIEITMTEDKKKLLKENNYTFLSAENDYNTAVENEKYAKAYYGSSSKEYDNYKITLSEAEVTFKNATNNFERSVISTNYNLELMQKTLKIYSDKKDLMNLALGLQNIRLKYGTATESEVITASINYNSAVNEYYQMLMNYNMLVRLYEKNIIS